MPLIAKLHASKFERKDYNKVKIISLKNPIFFKEHITKQGYKE